MSTPAAPQPRVGDEQQDEQRDVAEDLHVHPAEPLQPLDGAIRNAATRVPTTMAITNEITTSRTVTQKPELNSDQ